MRIGSQRICPKCGDTGDSAFCGACRATKLDEHGHVPMLRFATHARNPKRRAKGRSRRGGDLGALWRTVALLLVTPLIPYLVGHPQWWVALIVSALGFLIMGGLLGAFFVAGLPMVQRWYYRKRLRQVRGLRELSAHADVSDGVVRVRGRVRIIRSIDHHPEVAAQLSQTNRQCGRFAIEADTGDAIAIVDDDAFELWDRSSRDGSAILREGDVVEAVGPCRIAPLLAEDVAGGSYRQTPRAIVFDGTNLEHVHLIKSA